MFFGIGALIAGVFWTAPVWAASPPADAVCRGCHGDSQRTIELPSGEVLSIGIDLTTLAASPHSSDSTNPVPCSGCHTGRSRYRYPHAPNPATTQSEFRAEVSENCQNCHYPHQPFHSLAEVTDALPTCADCHGSHAISHVETLSDTMPDNCLTCHTDETYDWAVELISPRPGLGAGDPSYAGSTRCLGCHEDKYTSWSQTLHAKVIRDPLVHPEAVVADFASTDSDLTFGLDDVKYTLGGNWQQMYLSQNVSGTLVLMPAQWTVATQTWEPYAYHAEVNPDREWLPACGSCHVTGLDTETWGFTEFGVGCEGCHGPADAHASDPQNVKPFAEVDVQVCGACHSRGTSPDGFAFPASYRPGDDLSVHFSIKSDDNVAWPDGSAKLNHQQYSEWLLGSRKALAEENSCLTCHTVHDSGAATGQLTAPEEELCVSCHNKQREIVTHMPFHAKALQTYEFACTDCHMPKMATSATAFDLRDHSFLQPNPQGSVDHGGLEAMPNACNNCHNALGEDASWAAQTIAYAVEQRAPSSGTFFGPGPTPTSPPPPTPISSVGQPVQHEEVQTGQWLRTSFFVLLGVAALGLLYWIINLVRRRRVMNA